MTKFDELTEGELALLKVLGIEYFRLKPFTKNDIHWSNYPRTDVEQGYHSVLDSEAQAALKAANALEPQAFEINYLRIKRWAETGYISLASEKSIYTTFIITPRGLAFLAYHTKPVWRRWLVDTWADLRPELRSAAVSAITSLIVALLTAYLVITLHLK